MGCDHTGPEEVMEMSEQRLRERDRPLEDGIRFGWGENVDTMWKSVYIEIERRDGAWIVTKIDRSNQELTEDELGLQEIG